MNTEGNGENSKDVLQHLHRKVWSLRDGGQRWQVLNSVVQGIRDMGLAFDCCLLYIVGEEADKIHVRQLDLNCGEDRGEIDEKEKRDVIRFWEKGLASSNRQGSSTLLWDDPEHLFQRCGCAIGSSLEVPFSHGVIGVYHHDADRYDDVCMGQIEEIALVLSALYHRLEDLDSLRDKERQLRQIQRLQMVGRMTAEVAHEINNPLSVVIGMCDLLLDGQLDPDFTDSIEAIRKAGLQTQQVSSRLLDFVRGQKTDKEKINLNRLVSETLDLIRRSLDKAQIELEEDLEANLPWIEANAGQIQQVILNLVQNSRDALIGSRRTQGLIRMRTYTKDEEVVLECEDNGPGIPDEIREQIFEPFFTTKVNGQGTGLGLSVCAGIAREHGGRLRSGLRLLGACLVMELPIKQAPAMAMN